MRASLSICVMVPSARLELAQLSPLPPQDSVSTNFTTTALKMTRPNHKRIARSRQHMSLT
jgi:hypothetical protein